MRLMMQRRNGFSTEKPAFREGEVPLEPRMGRTHRLCDSDGTSPSRHVPPRSCFPDEVTFAASPLMAGLLILFSGLFHAVSAEEPLPANDRVTAAIEKSLPLLERGARGSLEQRKQCFNCHNQGLPIMALTVARSRGFSIDEQHLQEQLQFTADFLNRNQQRYRVGVGQGGQIDTAGYALWALDLGGWTPDETTSAVAEYLLRYQNDREHYSPDASRPPGEQSDFTSSYVALRGLKVYGTSEQQPRIQARWDRVREWVLSTVPQDNEDRVFQLRLMRLLDASAAEIQQAATDLISTQRDDGGWGQTDAMSSDAYATGTSLVALHEAAGLGTDDPVYRKGLAYLLSIQLDDGSWHVVSHSKPFQTYFESGYPHGKDQFISMAAASWSTTALALALPKSVTPAEQKTQTSAK